jgi:hypothetical protein
MKRSFALSLVLAGCLALTGCKKSPPPVVEVSGRVTLNGEPLPHADVQFVPELKDFGAEVNSSGVTDEKGEFTLTCALNSQPGAVVGTHRVLVSDTTPADARGMDGASQARLARHQASLTNRPIPPEYGNFTKTTLRVSVEKGKKTYEIALKR